MAVTITGSAGIASTVAFGSGLLLLDHTIAAGTGIPSTVAFGAGGALIQGSPLLTVYIEGVDRSTLVRMDTVTRSTRLGSRASAGFTILDESGAYQPTIDYEVSVYLGATLFFAGTVEAIEHKYLLGTSSATETAVRCTDYAALCDRRVIYAGYDTITGGFLKPTVANIVDRFLAGTGIWYAEADDDWAPVTQLGVQLFNYCTVAEAFNQLAAKVNGDWRVDFNRRLWFFPKNTGYMAAPVSITDNDGNLLPPVVLSKTRAKYANRVGVRNNVGRRLIWSDTHEAAGDMVIFSTTFALDYKPRVTVEDVEKIVVLGAGPHTGDWDFFYSQGGYSVVWNTAKSWPNGTVDISYPSPLSYVHWAEDATEIAAHGTYELVEEGKDLSDDTAMESYAAGLLSRYKEQPITMGFRTVISGFEPGQLLTVNLTKPAINDTLLITGVDSQERYIDGAPAFVHSIKAVTEQPQRDSQPTAYFGKLIERGKQPVDRIAQTIRFHVAGTIKGITNPGLETGEAEGVATAQREGILGEIKITFKSIEDGTPITSNIEIDVFLNGSSVFATDLLVLVAGGTSSASQWIFASDPMPVAKGDRFGFEVVAADAAAKDGILEIQILG